MFIIVVVAGVLTFGKHKSYDVIHTSILDYDATQSSINVCTETQTYECQQTCSECHRRCVGCRQQICVKFSCTKTCSKCVKTEDKICFIPYAIIGTNSTSNGYSCRMSQSTECIIGTKQNAIDKIVNIYPKNKDVYIYNPQTNSPTSDICAEYHKPNTAGASVTFYVSVSLLIIFVLILIVLEIYNCINNGHNYGHNHGHNHNYGHNHSHNHHHSHSHS